MCDCLIKQIKKLKVDEGDAIVLESDRKLTDKEYLRVSSISKDYFKGKCKILILEDGLSIKEVIKNEK